MGESEENNNVVVAVVEETPNSLSSSSSSFESENEELQRLEDAPPFWRNPRKLSKQLSMCETPRDIAWEKRRRQILRQERRNTKNGAPTPPPPLPHHYHHHHDHDTDDLTDEDLNELKGSIELGFGFNEEAGQRLCNTLPALDLYFAVNRQFLPSPVPSPNSSSKGSLPSPAGSSTSSVGGSSSTSSSSTNSLGARSSSFGSPGSSHDSEQSWKICGPGDDPQQVKTKLRHWAQVVACSVMQSS